LEVVDVAIENALYFSALFVEFVESGLFEEAGVWK
jgi:hypothetical protein